MELRLVQVRETRSAIPVSVGHKGRRSKGGGARGGSDSDGTSSDGSSPNIMPKEEGREIERKK